MKKKILFAEDEPTLAMVIKESLERKNYDVVQVSDGLQALDSYMIQRFDLIILDVMMPKLNGWNVAQEIRKQNKKIPILFLTAKSENEDLIKGYSVGGNDYLRKPFHLEELLLRVKELIERNKESREESVISVGRFKYSPIRQEIVFNENITKLSYKESMLLQKLINAQEEVLNRKTVLMDLWGDDNFFNARNMDVYISRLRKKLNADSNIQILNIRGFGYKLIMR
ncbi:MAG: DNA-binding response regulator [Chryseobacterium sp.]|nr:MAG: DNA-binding response regulator [Chryseobacterium sp.]